MICTIFYSTPGKIVGQIFQFSASQKNHIIDNFVGWGGRGAKRLKICHTYPSSMKPGTVIPYLKKIQKIYKSRDKPLKIC